MSIDPAKCPKCDPETRLRDLAARIRTNLKGPSHRTHIRVRIEDAEAIEALLPKPPKEHGCRCSECDHEWTTTEYPSPCPQCSTVWR